MKKIIVLILFFNMQALSAAMTKDFVVTRLNYDQEKKDYQIDFKNQAGVYKVRETLMDCLRELRESLKEKKPVRVVFKPMGLVITSCSKVSTK
ncbi:MAG: hypothetical protein H7281_06105 [Bacteriovorax sp.]|nr:hypothetical protein [Bacteriovorax sp.]